MAKLCMEVDIDAQTGAEIWMFAQNSELIETYTEHLSQYLWLLTYYVRSNVGFVLFPIMGAPPEDKGMVLRNIYNIHPSELPNEFGSMVVTNRKIADLLPEIGEIVDTYKQRGSVINVETSFKEKLVSAEILFLGCYFKIIEEPQNGTPQQP